jgi:hypothetical protein
MNWKEILSVILGIKKPQLIPIPVNNNTEKKR